MVVQGMKQLNMPVMQNLRADFKDFNPQQPDDWRTFNWPLSPNADITKPDGN